MSSTATLKLRCAEFAFVLRALETNFLALPRLEMEPQTTAALLRMTQLLFGLFGLLGKRRERQYNKKYIPGC